MAELRHEVIDVWLCTICVNVIPSLSEFGYLWNQRQCRHCHLKW